MSYQIILSDRMIPIGSRPQINPYLTRPAKVIVDPPEYPEETSSEGWLIDDVSQFLLAKESNELSNLIKPYGLFFNDDGSLAYTFDTETGYIIKFTCSDYDVTTLSYDSSKFVLNKVSNFYLDKTGTYLFLSLNYASAVYVYKMGTAWDISTIYYLNRESFGSTPTTSIYVSDNGFHLYIGTIENKILHYRMDYPLDINTIVYKDFIDISSEITTSSSGMVVSPDGTKMYILQLNSPELFQYELSTPYYLDGAQYEDKNISLTDDSSMSGLYVTNENNFFSYGFTTNIVYNYGVSEFINVTITSLDATNITTTSVTLNGSLLDDEYGVFVTETGFYWSDTNSNPTSLDNSDVAGSSVGLFSLSITELDPGTTYYFRAYATDGITMLLGEVLSAETQGFAEATITTLAATGITPASVTLRGLLANDAPGALVTETGFLWGTSPSTLTNQQAVGSSVGSFSRSITGLDPGTRYYYRAYATDGTTTLLGSVLSAKTQIEVSAGEYALVNDGNQIIDTGIYLQGTEDYETLVYPTSGGSAGFFESMGSWPNYDHSYLAMGIQISSKGNYGCNWGSLLESVGTAGQYNAWQIFNKSGQVISVEINNVELFNHTLTTSPPIQTKTCGFLGSNRREGYYPRACVGKGSYLKIWSNSSRSTLVCNMWAVPAGMYAAGASTPAPSNCMWDSVTQRYLINMGTGAFGIEVIN